MDQAVSTPSTTSTSSTGSASPSSAPHSSSGSALQPGTPAPGGHSGSTGHNQTGTGQTGGTGSTPNGQTQASQEFFDVTVDGKPQRLTRQEIINFASLGKAAHKKIQEAQEMKKSYETRQQKFKENPMAFLSDPANGLSKEQIRAELEKYYHREYIESEQLTTEQRELREYKRREQERLEMDKKRQIEEDDRALNTQTEQLRQVIQAQIIEAMDKSGLPKTKYNVQRIAFHMKQAHDAGFQAPLEFIAQQVKSERADTFRDLLMNSTPEQLLEMFGEAKMKELRRADLERIRQKKNPISGSNDINTGLNGVGNAGTGRMEKVYMGDVDVRLRKMRQTGNWGS